MENGKIQLENESSIEEDRIGRFSLAMTEINVNDSYVKWNIEINQLWNILVVPTIKQCGRESQISQSESSIAINQVRTKDFSILMISKWIIAYVQTAHFLKPTIEITTEVNSQPLIRFCLYFKILSFTEGFQAELAEEAISLASNDRLLLGEQPSCSRKQSEKSEYGSIMIPICGTLSRPTKKRACGFYAKAWMNLKALSCIFLQFLSGCFCEFVC